MKKNIEFELELGDGTCSNLMLELEKRTLIGAGPGSLEKGEDLRDWT